MSSDFNLKTLDILYFRTNVDLKKMKMSKIFGFFLANGMQNCQTFAEKFPHFAGNPSQSTSSGP